MKPELSDRINHILENIAHINSLFDGKSIDALRDPIVRAAYERFLEIISEASRHIDLSYKSRAGHIPWRRIEDLGNALRHAYHKIDPDILWTIYERDLGPLEDAVREML